MKEKKTNARHKQSKAKRDGLVYVEGKKPTKKGMKFVCGYCDKEFKRELAEIDAARRAKLEAIRRKEAQRRAAAAAARARAAEAARLKARSAFDMLASY